MCAWEGRHEFYSHDGTHAPDLLQDICRKYNIPTAFYEKFKDPQKAKDFIRATGAPIVVKVRD